MRLNRTVVTERETFLTAVFEAEPKLTIREAQEKLMEKFGRAMRPNKVLSIRKEIRSRLVNVLASPVTAPPPATVTPTETT